jgi:hypothetical protein
MGDDSKKNRQRDKSELAPDAWQRFERAVDVVAKSKPRPKTKAVDKPIGKKGESPKKVSRKGVLAKRRTARLPNAK